MNELFISILGLSLQRQFNVIDMNIILQWLSYLLQICIFIYAQLTSFQPLMINKTIILKRLFQRKII